MGNMATAYTCRFCGEEYESLEGIDVARNGSGFWCDCCNGFTYFEDKRPFHKFILLLESDGERESNSMQKKLRMQISPLRYPGGKSRIADDICTRINPANTDMFIEPFCGGGSVGLSLLHNGVVKSLVLNDLDLGIYSLFSVIKNTPEELVKRIHDTRLTHDHYFKAQEIIKSSYAGCSPLKAAWSLLVCNRLAYSGICKANPLGGRNGTSDKLLCRWNPDTIIKRILLINSMSDRLDIHNEDACSFIEEFYWKPNATMFIDPPYYEKGHMLYNKSYVDNDHEDLAFLLDELYKGCPGADMILTYDNHDFIKELYLYPEFEELKVKYSV